MEGVLAAGWAVGPDNQRLRDEGGEHLVVSRELIVANDPEVFAFIEAVVNRLPFPDAGDHVPAGLVEQVLVRGGRLSSEGQIRAQKPFLLHVRVVAGLDVDDVFDVLVFSHWAIVLSVTRTRFLLCCCSITSWSQRMRARPGSSGGQPLLSGDVGLFKDFLDEMGGDILAVGIGDGLSIPSSFHMLCLPPL